jgi:acetyl-CoA carboxylase biotin carboxyl carrier protein
MIGKKMKEVKSNVSGIVINVLVKVGETIAEDQDIVSVESMKMEMFVPSTASGTVQEIKVKAEDFVQEGQTLLLLS